MKRMVLLLGVAVLTALPACAQTQDVKFIADTLVVQADGKYEADPDLATLNFQISAQEKELRKAYDKASQSMQRIVQIAEKNGLAKADIAMGRLTVTPFYQGDRKRSARAYRVEGEIDLKVRDFAKIGPLIDDSVEEGVVDLRSLSYSLADEEAAKRRAVEDATRNAAGRARTALESNGQKLGALRYVNLDVKQVIGMARPDVIRSYATVEVQAGTGAQAPRGAAGFIDFSAARAQKLVVTATVQCIFQIQQ